MKLGRKEMELTNKECIKQALEYAEHINQIKKYNNFSDYEEDLNKIWTLKRYVHCLIITHIKNNEIIAIIHSSKTEYNDVDWVQNNDYKIISVQVNLFLKDMNTIWM